MTNPYSWGTLATLPNGPGQATDSLTALASNNAKGLGVIDMSAAPAADCFLPPMKIKSGASGTSSTGYLTVYIITSEDNTIWTDGIDPTSTSDQAAKIATATTACVIAVTANATTYYTPEISIYALLGFVPKYAAVVVRNQSGAALDSTAGNFSAKYQPLAFA